MQIQNRDGDEISVEDYINDALQDYWCEGEVEILNKEVILLQSVMSRLIHVLAESSSLTANQIKDIVQKT